MYTFMARISLNGFTYSYEGGEYDVFHSYSTPQTFFKYFALNEYSVDALTNMYIYATHPNQLNDLSDCHSEIISINDKETLEYFAGPYLGEIQKAYKDEKSLYNFITKAYKEMEFGKLGIYSLTSKPDNEVMWAIYAQNKGFCLELDVKKFYFKTWGPFPINYVEELPRFETKQYGIHIPILVQSLVKRKVWEREHEWRLLIHGPEDRDMERYDNYGRFNQDLTFKDAHNRKFNYSISALKSVRLAPHFFGNCLAIRSVSPIELHVTFKEGTLEHKVLSFLSRIQDQYPLEVYCSMVDIKESIKFYSVHIIQLDEENYRLLEIIN